MCGKPDPFGFIEPFQPNGAGFPVLVRPDPVRAGRQHQVKRLVFAHIGRPSLRAIDAGYSLPFGEWGQPGRTYRIWMTTRASLISSMDLPFSAVYPVRDQGPRAGRR